MLTGFCNLASIRALLWSIFGVGVSILISIVTAGVLPGRFSHEKIQLLMVRHNRKLKHTFGLTMVAAILMSGSLAIAEPCADPFGEMLMGTHAPETAHALVEADDGLIILGARESARKKVTRLRLEN